MKRCYNKGKENGIRGVVNISMKKYAQLKVFSKYNYTSSFEIHELIQKCKKEGIESIALTDKGTMHHIVDFYEAAIKEGIKPIFGCSFSFYEKEIDKEVYFTLLAKNQKGYENVVKLSTAYECSKEKKQKKLDKNEFLKHYEDTIMLLNMKNWKVENQSIETSVKMVQAFKKMFGEDVYLEVKSSSHAEDEAYNRYARTIAGKTNTSHVAVNDVSCLEKEEVEVVHFLEKEKKEESLEKQHVEERYVKTQQEMEHIFQKDHKALENTLKIASMCNVSLKMKGKDVIEGKLPPFPIPKNFKFKGDVLKYFNVYKPFNLNKAKEGRRAIEYFCYLAWQGFKREYANRPKEEMMKLIKDLKHELGIIIKKGFVNYFLIVQDFIMYGKNNDIPMGRGRGSVVSSITAKCLRITETDPTKYNLFFERFLNEERQDNPDIDVDVSQEKRHLLYRYIEEKYQHVTKVATFKNYGPKSAFEKACAYLKVAKETETEIVKVLEKEIKDLQHKNANVSLALEKTLSMTKVQKMIAKNPTIKKVFFLASKVSGKPEHSSVHAAAIILDKEPLLGKLPLMKTMDHGREIYVSQVANNTNQLEKIGYTKIDLLGIADLDTDDKTEKWIEKIHGVSTANIPFNDKKTMNIFKSGDLLGIFQLHSYAMRKISMDLQPDKMEEIMAVLSLYRPGSKDMIPVYIKNKKKNNTNIYDANNQVLEGTEDIQPILDPSYGIIVYQEQVIQIAKVWAGYTTGQAETFRQIISKKKTNLMEKEKENFIRKSLEQGRDKSISERLFEMILKFGKFGFNRAHTAAYTEMSYKMAYYKTHYSTEFMAMLISSPTNTVDKAAGYIKEANKMGVTVFPPNINTSEVEFTPSKEGIIFGLSMIRNVGTDASEKIIQEREKGSFTSFQNFLQRTKSIPKINKKIMESLIKAGAFDCFGSRKEIAESFEKSLEGTFYAKHQYTFFDIPFMQEEVQNTAQVEDYSISEKIEMEKQIMSIAFTKRPISPYVKVASYLEKHEVPKKDHRYIGGVITKLNPIIAGNGKEMAFLKVERNSEKMDVVVFTNQWMSLKNKLKEGKAFLFLVRIDKEKDKMYLVDIKEIEQAKKEIIVTMEERTLQHAKLDIFRNKLRSFLKEKGEDVVTILTPQNKKQYDVCMTYDFISFLQEMESTIDLKVTIQLTK